MEGIVPHTFLFLITNDGEKRMNDYNIAIEKDKVTISILKGNREYKIEKPISEINKLFIEIKNKKTKAKLKGWI